MEEIKTISSEQFAALDISAVTLLDLREKDEVLVDGISEAINIPFSEIGRKLETIPRDKPVYVFCRTGEWSSEVTELLSDMGYEAYSLTGGFKAYSALIRNMPPLKIDAKGLKCPGPIVKVADAMRELKVGQKILVEATEDSFASDIAVWCERTGNRLISLETKPDMVEATVQKRDRPAGAKNSERNDKTFVVFSGDLDKTIAAFIMANGAAAMGRKVTMFFTFWGLNILRRPERLSIKKRLVERAFGMMMPRGTKKLGLSRMNMGGMGAKMVRAVMKNKGISSLEELIQSAVSHGVKLVACQMSMEIMGIRREELIDGVELGGVSTFLGSGEQSDMSLFI